MKWIPSLLLATPLRTVPREKGVPGENGVPRENGLPGEMRTEYRGRTDYLVRMEHQVSENEYMEWSIKGEQRTTW